MTKKIGRPEIELKWDVLDAVLQYGAQLTDCAEFCGCSEDTIQNRIKQEFGLTFTEYRARKLGRTRVSIMKKQIEKALAGDTTMLIWVGKNICNQADKISTEVDDTPDEPVTLAYSIPGNKYSGKPDIEVLDGTSGKNGSSELLGQLDEEHDSESSGSGTIDL